MKFIDLYSTILEDQHANISPRIRKTLNWLDEHPDQVPGRTMTQSRYAAERRDRSLTYMRGFDAALIELGATVVDDPKPTNAEKLAIYLGLHDLDAITQDGVAEFARQLDADGVKAPGGDDE